MKADSNLGCIFQKLVDFKDTKRAVQTNRRVTALDLRTVDCSLVRDLLGRNNGATVCKGKGTQQRLADLQGHLPQNTRTVDSQVQKVEQAWQKAVTEEQENSDRAQTHIQSESKDELRKNTETWPTHAEMELGKPKLSWAWI